MRKGILKGIVLGVVFIITIIATSILTHKNNIDLTTKMPEASLPVVYLHENGTAVNELYGYTAEMDGTSVRDTIVPLGEDLTLPVTIKPFQSQIEEISYQVRTMDMERLIEEGRIESFSQEDGEINLDLKFENILEKENEYMLVLKVQCDGKDVYYYTRMLRENGYYIKESVDFVMDFHEKSFSGQNAGSLATYLEPNPQQDNNTLQKVTIHSSLKQVTWADFKGDRLEKPIPSIKEIGTTYNTIVLNYVVTAAGEDGGVEYYNVEEYYRVRYSDVNKRMHLLNYERTMNEIFRGENDRIKDKAISLGVRSKDVEYMTNERGSVTAFVQEGELWSYSRDDNRLSKVYSFRGAEGIEDRENNPQHQIKVIKIDEAGSMDFVVFGYMNRGEHEGRTGVAVFHYDGVENTTEEELFIPSDKSYEVLKAEWANMFYVSDGNVFYLLVENSLYSINLYSRECRQVLTELVAGQYAVAENGRYIAWQKSKDRYSADAVKVMDLEGEEVRTIQAEAGEYLQPIGFVQNDFVYGAAKQSDVVNDSAGNTQFPMYRVRIVDEKSEVVKDYQRDGYYITKAYVENETVFLDRVYRNGTGYLPAEQDTIKNQQLEAGKNVTVGVRSSGNKQNTVQFVYAGEVELEIPQVTMPKEVLVEEDRSVTLDTKAEQEIYYVYSAGKIIKATPFVSEAVQAADAAMGVVIGDRQQYIWRRGRSTVQPIVGDVNIDTGQVGTGSVSRCLAAILQTENISMDVEGLLAQGEMPKHILAEALSDCKVIDLSGCSLEQVLYYVNLKTPVLAMVNNEALLIVGYDEHNTILYDPQSNTTYKKGLNDSKDMFEGAGNLFLGYIR